MPAGLPEALSVDVANRLNSAAIHLIRRLRMEDEAAGVTPARLSALSVLVFGGPRSITRLAEAERVAPPTMTRVVDALERDGLVVRASDQRDRRVVRVRASAKGRRVMERARGLRVRRLAGELQQLSEAELQTLDRAVDILLRMEEAETAG